MDYEKISLILKAMADPKRMKIIDLLSYSSMCACDVLKHFDFTQPTLSHHMKVLESAGIVSVSKQSQWHHYSLREDFVKEFMGSMVQLLSDSSSECLCQNTKELEGDID
ncbi:transcriptional regulator [Enterococcus plantarum]|uniref:ArsR/SmtB family transcription factor n=1 Tax=Enterococcus TaxID=1350 RepID=UPI00084CF9EF|nr:metalloregulator ArsR/SmtB family transcription factor [Enterococcus plantarum]MBO0423155.1 winged helix-turn-helix transcriptional regulator [Enterococcus plantarum]OEG11193.1 transcriptional regulator [Enterococcus plantarum]